MFKLLLLLHLAPLQKVHHLDIYPHGSFLWRMEPVCGLFVMQHYWLLQDQIFSASRTWKVLTFVILKAFERITFSGMTKLLQYQGALVSIVLVNTDQVCQKLPF